MRVARRGEVRSEEKEDKEAAGEGWLLERLGLIVVKIINPDIPERREYKIAASDLMMTILVEYFVPRLNEIFRPYESRQPGADPLK